MKESIAQLVLQPLRHVLMGPIHAQPHNGPGQERHELATIAGPQLCAKDRDDSRGNRK